MYMNPRHFVSTERGFEWKAARWPAQGIATFGIEPRLPEVEFREFTLSTVSPVVGELARTAEGGCPHVKRESSVDDGGRLQSGALCSFEQRAQLSGGDAERAS